MSLEFNSDKQRIVGTNPQLVGSTDFTIRSGAGASEREIFRAQLDQASGLPRIGINRTGRRVERIVVTAGGSGYTTIPSVTLSPPNLSNGRQALASAIVNNNQVVAIVVDDIGDGYSSAPSVSISGTTGAGATAQAFLDTVDFELDVAGAIRTSTSIISDTARILNLDINNLVTPDVNIRAANLKTYANNTGTSWVPNTVVQHNSGNPYRYYENNVYQALNTGVTSNDPPSHTDGIVTNGTVQFKHIGFRVANPALKFYNQTGDSGLFPRSITPLQGDRSDKIATTEYVLNLATNDVGGRVYVSEQIGDDANDGRSAVAPVRSIKRACQIASQTVGVKETVIVAGGEYIEDNPIAIPPDCSVVGDNLRLVIIRPQNPGKHMFKLSDKNYINGVTFRDYVDSNGDPVHTWDYAVVFDDKQRIYYDPTYGGDFERNFPIGHQIFGPNRVRVTFQNHNGSTNLIIGTSVRGLNTGSTGLITAVNFNTVTGPSAYQSGTVDINVTTGVFNAGETFEYEVGVAPSIDTYEFVASKIESIRAEGEVVSHNTDITNQLPIVRVDGSLQGTFSDGFGDPGYTENLGGIVLYTNLLIGRQNTHDFKEGQEIEISGLSGDLAVLNGKQRIYKILRDADGRSRRFVIPKSIPTFTNDNFVPANASVKSYAYSVTVSLLNSPNKFDQPEPVSRRFQDACNLIRNNIDFIIDETYLQVAAEFPSLVVPNQTKCRRDIGHFVDAIIRDLEFGGNYNVVEAAEYYVQGTQIGYISNEITETVRAFDIARKLAIIAMRNWRTGGGTLLDPVYTPLYSSAVRYFDDTVITATAGNPACADVKNAIDTLGYLFAEIITNNTPDRFLDASYLIARNQDFIAEEALGYAENQYPSLGLSVEDQDKCKRDIKFILTGLRRDLSLGGNAGIVTAAEAYFTGVDLTGIPSGELPATRYAFEKVRDLAILAMRNWKTGSDGTGSVYTPIYSSIPLFTDSTIIVDSSLPICANVASTITTSFALLDDILAGDIEPGQTVKTYGTLYDVTPTYPEGTLYDADNKRITPRGIWSDLPIIEASPYIQNSSIISFLGGSGVEVDGDKVTQPNSPFPGLESDGRASYPNQGKSMVASAFTIVSFGGIGYKVVNDGYTQLVSVFVIFCADGVFCDTGGYASVTNSATNFGTYALRARGYRKEAYEFDVATITNVSTTPTGRTIFTVSGLGREPLEHYIVKIDGYENQNTNIEYFVEAVSGVSVAAPYNATLTLDSAASFRRLSDGAVVSPSVGEFNGKTIRLHRPSIVNSSSHTWEFAGAGTNYNALPENGGVKVEANEQVSENYGRVYTSGTDELGDFKVGYFAKIENRTGAITFTGTVTISEVEFLKLKGGDVVVTGFSADSTLGGNFSSNSLLPTQKAVKDYITNNLGSYIGKQFSTLPTPNALVELTASGKIAIEQIPALRPFDVYTIANQAERLALEGALAGDIAIQSDTSQSFILNNDNSSLFFSFVVDPTLQFATNSIITGSGSGGQLQVTEYRSGVVYTIVIDDPGSGYTSAPTVTISGGNPGLGAVSAAATATIASGRVVTIKLISFNSLVGGKGYTTQPTVTISAPGAGGTQATATALIESRVYGNIVNNIKIVDTDTVQSTDVPSEIVDVIRVVNTSSKLESNWVSLSSNQISADSITSGVLSISRITQNADAANSFTFYRGDQAFAPALQSLRGSETRYFAKLKTTANIGATSLIFSSNNNMLLGHSIVNNVSGISANTSITNVVTEGSDTTITINNPLSATINAGTLLEFTRPQSSLVLGSSYTQGGFIDDIVIVTGGSGFTNGTYFDVPFSGGTGTGLRANIVVTSNTISSVVVTDGGINYTDDFEITTVPTVLSGGTGMVLSAKLSTQNKVYANATIDVRKVDDKTISADPYGNAGVARFRKEQFNIGLDGNGSVQLRTGADSGLDADLLDGAQGSFYLNASNLNAGTVSIDRLSGTYNISISGQSGSTLRLATTTGNPTSNPLPSTFSAGIIADTKNNTADALSDGGSRHLVLTLRNGGSGNDTTFGGVRQLAFSDNDNMWIRGSGSGVSSFGSWAKVWTSLNDGPDTGMDADKLDNRQGIWYQNALNINFGILSDFRLPTYQSAKDLNNSLRILETTNKSRYDIYISGQTLTTTPFLAGLTVNLYDQNAQAVGTILISNVTVNDDTSDNSNDYTIISGVLDSGNFTNAIEIGTASNRVRFNDYTLNSGGTYEAIKLFNDSGTARLRMGRIDGVATSPSIYFNTSATAASNYNAAIVAFGGTSADGSGSLNFIASGPNAVTINSNTIWNAGNITFSSANSADTAVRRDASGNFSANTITASLTGAASANVLKSGDTMTGSLTISGSTSDLSVGRNASISGNATVTGNLTVDTNTLFVDATNNRVGVGTASPTSGDVLSVAGRLGIRNSTNSVLVEHNGTIGSITSNNGLTLFAGGSNTLILNTNNTARITVAGDGLVGIGKTAATGFILDAAGKGRFEGGLELDTSNDNSGTFVSFFGASTNRNFRIGNQLVANHLFTIQSSTANGGSTWNSTSILTVDGLNNRIGINNNAPAYALDVTGDVNFTGTITQNGQTLTSSNWTKATNTTDIYRLSRVGVGVVDPTWTLQVGGNGNNGVNITGFNYGSTTIGANNNQNNSVLYANGDRQWIDGYGVIKVNRNTISENVTIPTNTNAISAGGLTIVDGFTVVIQDGAEWTIL
jgi:hypothetical protein